MKIDIRAGKRVLYKHQNKWCIGELIEGEARLTNKGLYLFILPEEFFGREPSYCHDAEINDIYFDAVELSELEKRNTEMFMTKEKYIEFVESEDFIAGIEHAWVSDGEYYYYPVNKFNKIWLEKQPFKYIIRGA